VREVPRPENVTGMKIESNKAVVSDSKQLLETRKHVWQDENAA